MTDKTFKISKQAGISLIIIALTTIISGLFTAYGNYRDGSIAVKLMEVNAKQKTKVVGVGKFTNSNVGVYEFKPTMAQAIILSESGLSGMGAATLFYLMLGGAILTLSYKNLGMLENITETRLWQAVALGGILFFALKFLSKFLINNYVSKLVGHEFKYFQDTTLALNFTILSLIAVLAIIYDLLSYSRKLKEENDLTI
ncbi:MULTISPECIES: hypothetical protein [Pedobacter]|uniref:hypothetical protein n=1 Tax=Pedobacter TaxID=84567 RepID=UPI001E62BCD4|nr:MULTISPECIES: hypothetical protein [Pedobacter]